MDRSTDLFQIIWIPNWYLSFHFHAWSQRTDKRIPEKKAFLWSVQLLYKTFNSFLNMKMIYVRLDMLDEIVLLQNKRCLTCTLSHTWILLYIPIFWYNRCNLYVQHRVRHKTNILRNTRGCFSFLSVYNGFLKLEFHWANRKYKTLKKVWK